MFVCGGFGGRTLSRDGRTMSQDVYKVKTRPRKKKRRTNLIFIDNRGENSYCKFIRG